MDLTVVFTAKCAMAKNLDLKFDPLTWITRLVTPPLLSLKILKRIVLGVEEPSLAPKLFLASKEIITRNVPAVSHVKSNSLTTLFLMVKIKKFIVKVATIANSHRPAIVERVVLPGWIRTPTMFFVILIKPFNDIMI